MTARERATIALRRAGIERAYPIDHEFMLDSIEKLFREHASEAVALARQEWEAEQAESGFRLAALSGVVWSPFRDVNTSREMSPIGDQTVCWHGVPLASPCSNCPTKETT